MRPPDHGALSALLLPLSALYGIVVRVRNARYARGMGVVAASIPVVSVGNLTVGGTGKTPLVARLASDLLTLGRRPAVVSRGYRGRAGRGPVVVGRGAGPELPVEIAGDEPFMLASRLAGVAVVVGSDRVRGVEAARGVGADVAILDDGFQHRRLARALDVVVVDAARPFGNGRLLPAGSLREPRTALARAGLVVSMDGNGAVDPDALRRLGRIGPEVPLLGARKAPVGFFLADGTPAETPRRAVAFCGIGSPARFRRDLAASGVVLDAFHAMDDHHRYTEAELGKIHSECIASDAVPVTTEKDLARISGRDLPPGFRERLRVLRVEVVMDDDEALRTHLARAVREAAAC